MRCAKTVSTVTTSSVVDNLNPSFSGFFVCSYQFLSFLGLVDLSVGFCVFNPVFRRCDSITHSTKKIIFLLNQLVFHRPSLIFIYLVLINSWLEIDVPLGVLRRKKCSVEPSK